MAFSDNMLTDLKTLKFNNGLPLQHNTVPF